MPPIRRRLSRGGLTRAVLPAEVPPTYTCQQPGQYTTIFGAGSTREGSVFFAGEHTSTSYWGYLNGAVESGERAAKEAALS